MVENTLCARDSGWRKAAETISAMTGIPIETLNQMRYDTESMDKAIAATGNDPIWVRNSAVLASITRPPSARQITFASDSESMDVNTYTQRYTEGV